MDLYAKDAEFMVRICQSANHFMSITNSLSLEEEQTASAISSYFAHRVTNPRELRLCSNG